MKISSSSSLYIDTSIYIYFFENHPRFGVTAEELFVQVLEDETPLFASQLLFTELLVLPLKEKNEELVQLYLALPGTIPTLMTIDLTRAVAVLAAELRAKYHLHTPDAIHLATAIDQKASYFICSDARLTRVKEIEVVSLPV